HKEGMEQPIWHWTPSIAVCGMKIYKGEEFRSWNENILVTSLKFEYLERVVVKGRKKVDSEIIYEPGSRVRDVEIDSLGNIYVALENPGRIVKLSTGKQ
ncbi:MAG: PQQ-dependent sugar dehydrogenase, partial [Candidatus Neomarinimicrobiota bacterium]